MISWTGRYEFLVWTENCLSLTDSSAFTGFWYTGLFTCTDGALLDFAEFLAPSDLFIRPGTSLKLPSSSQIGEILRS